MADQNNNGYHRGWTDAQIDSMMRTQQDIWKAVNAIREDLTNVKVTAARNAALIAMGTTILLTLAIAAVKAALL